MTSMGKAAVSIQMTKNNSKRVNSCFSHDTMLFHDVNITDKIKMKSYVYLLSELYSFLQLSFNRSGESTFMDRFAKLCLSLMKMCSFYFSHAYRIVMDSIQREREYLNYFLWNDEVL